MDNLDNSHARRKPSNSVDREAFRLACRRFSEREIEPRWLAADRAKAFPREFYVAAAHAGLLGITASEQLGGSDLGVYEEAIAMEEMAKFNPNFAVSILSQYVAGAILCEYGNEQQKEIARRNIAGNCLLAIAVTEPEAGNDVQNIKTSAVRRGDYWILNGVKSFITLGGDAQILITLAQTDTQQGRTGMQFFAVDRQCEGVTLGQIETYVNRPAPTYRIMFNDVRVPESQRINAGFREIMAGFNRERILIAARWLGHMQHALAWAKEYACVREQFGRPIGSNQSIAFLLAQSHVDVEATRHLTYHAAMQWDSGIPIRDLILDVSSAKLLSTQAVVRVTQAALHVAGGWGLTEELPAMRMALDALVAPVTAGSLEIQLRVIAREMGLPVI